MTEEQKQNLKGWSTAYPFPIMGLLAAMRQFQEWELCISSEAENYLAELFGVSITRVHSVATFFAYFTQSPTKTSRINYEDITSQKGVR